MVPVQRLEALQPGQVIPFGGNRTVRVADDLADAFRPGDHLVVVQDTGALLHVPAADQGLVERAVDAARDAFMQLARASDDQITAFFDTMAARMADDDCFAPIQRANEADVESARSRGRSTTRLELTPTMRADMVEALIMWRDLPASRDAVLEQVEHDGWTVEARRGPLGVVGFVFEGRPNVFADATGVLRSGNTVVFRIGSDALGTARAIVEHALAPALAEAGLPEGAVVLVDAPSHAAGWALFSHSGLALAVARGSGRAVAELGAVARQAGTPVSLHGTGGAWMVATPSADPGAFRAAVAASLDRKVCNTLNVCCIVRDGADELLPSFLDGVASAAEARSTSALVHVVGDDLTHIVTPGIDLQPLDEADLATEWEWEDRPEVSVVVVDHMDHAVELCNRYSPRFVASLVSDDPAEHDRFWAMVDAPFVGNGFTRWVDGQYALGRPELGLSNWQGGRLFARGGVLSGDGVHTVRLRAVQNDPDLRR